MVECNCSFMPNFNDGLTLAWVSNYTHIQLSIELFIHVITLDNLCLWKEPGMHYMHFHGIYQEHVFGLRRLFVIDSFSVSGRKHR